MKAQTSDQAINLQQYKGLWYILASKPTSFDKNWTNIKEEYVLNDKGTYNVITYYKKPSNPERKNVKHTLIPRKGNKANLWTDRFNFFVRADYLIHKVSTDYSWAVVGHPKHKYVYILSRTMQMEDNLYNELMEYIVKLGYKKEEVKKIPQN